MSTTDKATKLLPIVREYGRLERKRTGEGVTPKEFYRWSELRQILEQKFPQGDRPPEGERRRTLRLPTRMVVEFQTEGELQQALIRNISRGGLFIATDIRPEPGTRMDLLIRVARGQQIELPVEIVCTSIPGPNAEQGMGCKFASLNPTQQQIVDEMFATAIDANP